VDFLECGNPAGSPVIYFHGAPGAPEECFIFDEYAKTHNLNIICYDRFAADLSLQNDSYYKYLAEVIADKAVDGKVDLIGFSIGCHTAIETSLYLGETVRELHLISCAAPLEAADFLNDMAGKTVFSIALKSPRLFTLLSYWQTLLSYIAPNILFKILFASAFREYMKPILGRCFSANAKGYIREIKSYVAPWKESVLKCRARAYLWHGANDNWSPLGMANYLNENMPSSSSLESFEGLSHYSCLYAAAPKICSQLEKA